MILNLHRKFFLNKNFNYRLTQDDFNYIKSKFVGFNLNKDKIKTLAIGSSHCENSLIPILFDSCTFNLGLSSLDMFGCYHIYKNNADLPCLKNIFLFYSVFFPGYDLLDTAFHWHSKSIHYRHFFNIPYHDNLIDRDYFQKQIKKLEKNSNKYKINFFDGYFFDNSPWEPDVKRRCAKHKELFLKSLKGLNLLQEMVKIAKIKNHNLYIIIPPYRTDYREEMGEYVFENQKKILSEYIDVNNIIDCYKSISDEYFLNCDHLNSNGAIKLSILLNKQIEDEEKND